MDRLKAKIEKIFELLTTNIYHNKWIYIFLMVTLISLLSAPIYKLTVDTATESMLHKDDPSLVRYNNYRDQFGRTEFVIVLVEAPDIFDISFIRKLEKLHNELKERVPYLNKVTSLVSVRNIHEEKGTLYVDELMKDFEDKDLSEVKKRALENRFYRNYIISKDGKSTAITVETMAKVRDNKENSKVSDDLSLDLEEESTETFHYITADEKAEVNRAIEGVIEKYKSPGFKLTFSGSSVVVDLFNSTTLTDIGRVIKIMTVVIIFFLFLLFRRFSGVVIPCLIVYTSMVSTLGLMAFTKTPISLMTNLIPGFLVAVGIADAVHVLSIFYRKFDEGVSKEEAICYAMGHSGLAILMTSITTAAGLLSFSVAEIATISEMGCFASVGVILALLYTIILLPALIAALPIKRKERKEQRSGKMDKTLKFFADTAINNPKKIVAVSVIFLIVSVCFIVKLEFSSFILSYFPEDHYVKKDLQYIESRLENTIAFEAVIDTGVKYGLYEPSILKSIERLEEKISKIKNHKIYVGKTVTINDIIKETNMALHENREEFYSIPETRKEVAQTLLLFENAGPEELEQVCDSVFRKTRFSIRSKWADSVYYEDFLDELNIMFEKEFRGKAKVTVTGLSAILARTIPAALKSMLESYIIAIIVITILMLFLVGDLKLGFLSMIPNLLPIIMVMGLIRMSGLNVDINTLFIGSIALGLVVDDTIHFMYNFKKYYVSTGSPKTAIYETIFSTGRAMLITSIVLSLNFFVLLTSTLNHSMKFGLFTGIAIIFALLADFLLAPGLMMLFNREKDVKEVL